MRLTGSVLAPSPFVLVGDHAGNAVPAALAGLGLPAGEIDRHIGHDIGSQVLGEALSARLRAPFLSQRYSRLVIDCNRDPAHAEAIAEVSDATPIPGNRGLSAEARAARVGEVFEPYQAGIAAALDARAAAGLTSVLVSVHSFTPVWQGLARTMEIGVLHDGRKDAFALAVLEALRADGSFAIADNAPYAMDATDYTVPRHAYPRGLSYVEIEVRQDLLPARVDQVADVLARSFVAALDLSPAS